MKLKKLLKKLGYTDEQIEQIVNGMKDAKLYITEEENIDERYSKLKEQKTELEGQLSERDKQLEELSKKAKGNEELESTIQELKDLNKSTLENYENKLKERDFNYKLEVALRDSKVKNSKAVQALLDKDSIKLDGDKLLGLEDQIKALKETDSYLFEDDISTGTGGAGNFGKKDKQEEPESLGTRLAKANTSNDDAIQKAKDYYFKGGN